MTQRTVLIAVVAIVLAAAAVMFLGRSQPAPRPAAVETPAATPAPEPAKPAAPSPEAAPAVPAPRARRRAPAPSRPVETPAPDTAAPSTGTLHIDSDVPGADVFIDRRYIGKTPVTADHVTPGSHRLNVSAPGVDGVAETIDVEPGSRDLLIKLKEVRLDAAIDVVHKHAFGSCQGRLIATPQQLRYQTTNRKDAFAVPLADLDNFTVDYLAKTLTVGLKGGRTYHFTDPAGNADRLFVFHRDVAMVLKRLQAK